MNQRIIKAWIVLTVLGILIPLLRTRFITSDASPEPAGAEYSEMAAERKNGLPRAERTQLEIRELRERAIADQDSSENLGAKKFSRRFTPEEIENYRRIAGEAKAAGLRALAAKEAIIAEAREAGQKPIAQSSGEFTPFPKVRAVANRDWSDDGRFPVVGKNGGYTFVRVADGEVPANSLPAVVDANGNLRGLTGVFEIYVKPEDVRAIAVEYHLAIVESQPDMGLVFFRSSLKSAAELGQLGGTLRKDPRIQKEVTLETTASKVSLN